MPTWPAGLPQSLNVDGYAETIEDGRVRTSVDSGPVLVRRRYSAVTTYVSGYMVLTDAEYATLLTFFDSTLSGGSATFDWHPRGKHTASPQVILTMRFAAPPSRRPVAGNSLWQVDLSFEVLP